ncbi:MAG TPA: hypothetical protein VGP46_06930, partial [Acidimicrobiales bacterium]|nr:hypothetical protein [Acidimicrobiales bacterium]
TNTTKYGNTYAGMQAYISQMNKYEPAFTYNDVSFQGWQSAALLAAGIKAAGNDLSQANVVAVTNKITNFNGGGTSAPVNWAVSHTSTTLPNCSSWIQVQGKVFAVVFATGKQVFVCVGANAKDPVPVAAPAGTPGS